VKLLKIGLAKCALCLVVIEIKSDNEHIKAPQPEANSREITGMLQSREKGALKMSSDAHHGTSMRTAPAGWQSRRSCTFVPSRGDAIEDALVRKLAAIQVGFSEQQQFRLSTG
jgi:hypothetical protein